MLHAELKSKIRKLWDKFWSKWDDKEELSGNGRVRLEELEALEEELKIHKGDSSKFLARRTLK